MPHALVLIFGDTVRAAEAFDRHIDLYCGERLVGDNFRGWVMRVGKKVIKDRLQDLTAVPSHTAHVGFVGEQGRDLDQVVATVFRAPRSSTGEDVVEFTCHGGDVAAPLVLEALVAAGARHALPGEFTFNPDFVVQDRTMEYFRSESDLIQGTIRADLGFANLTSYTQYRKETVDASIELDYTQLRGF